eukprot:scaffold6596_cov73-Cylindrotheca_fusiformis.AAC.1
MFVPEPIETPRRLYYFERSARRALVGESLIAEGRWTESAVLDHDVPLPQNPPGERLTPNWNRVWLDERNAFPQQSIEYSNRWCWRKGSCG